VPAFGMRRLMLSDGTHPNAPGGAKAWSMRNATPRRRPRKLRALLAENAKHFSAETSVEARVVCELEWDDVAFSNDDD